MALTPNYDRWRGMAQQTDALASTAPISKPSIPNYMPWARKQAGVGSGFDLELLQATLRGQGYSGSTNTSSAGGGGYATGELKGARFPYSGWFEQAGKQYGVSPKLLAAVAKAESNFNPRAGSPAGATGLMQFMPGTAREMGVNPRDPKSSIFGAAKLLKQHMNKFGSVDKALAAYNAGPGAVQKYGGIPPYRETQNYVKKIRGYLRGSVASMWG